MTDQTQTAAGPVEIKQGAVVAIYQYPFSGEGYEGDATLFKKYNDNPNSLWWWVKFPGDEEVYNRYINPENCTPKGGDK